VSRNEPTMRHLTDEELLLDYYEEASSADRARVQTHLEACEECRALDSELRAVLTAVETTPLDEPPSGFEREMWARIEPLLPVGGSRSWPWSLMAPRWVVAAGVAALMVAAFALGRISDLRDVSVPQQAADESDANQRLLESEVEDHFERSRRVLVDLVNDDIAAADLVSNDRARAADLVAAGRLYRQSAESGRNPDMGDLLEDLERVLMEVANATDTTPDEVARLRERIDDQDLLLRLRVVATEMRERGRHVQHTW